MNRRVGVAVGTTLVACVLSFAAALPAAATPKPSDPPVSGDPRATPHEGNVTTCAQAGLAGSEVEVGFVLDPTKTFVTITSVPANIELTGTVVKGGDNYNVYPPSARTLLHAPLVGKDDKNIPQISHWFACGEKKNTTTTTTTTTTSTSTTTAPGGGDGSTTTTPAGQGSGGAVGDDELANTGFSATGPLIGAGALLLIGSGLLFGLRRTRGHRR